MTEINYWLMKSEPDAYSIDTLKNDDVTLWDGIRNYQARNFMRKMNKGDNVFFYHSNCKPPGIVGLMEVIDLNIVDPTQFDQDSKYFDPKSKPDNPRWDCVKVEYKFQKSSLNMQELNYDKNSKVLNNKDQVISFKCELQENLQKAMKEFVEEHPNWDQYRILQAAIAGFLMQKGFQNRDLTRLYIGNMFSMNFED